MPVNAADIRLPNAGTEYEADPAEVAAVTKLFRDSGFDVEFQPGLVRLSAAVHPWVVYFTTAVPLAVFLAAFAKRSGELAAEEAWKALRKLVDGIVAARRESLNGHIDIEDWDASATASISADVSDEALEALMDLDWSRAARGRLGWNSQEDEWRDGDNNPVPKREPR